ncbi:bifunctional heptose 7-phosphate kinase/heptose 1-phosphate adenyltransferase [Paenibacillus mesophilus]|uniref:bifunctional heptose 7-phosphate kinase/heptose 1-phosphate adenyltransferase n=1 Tax=Paenibacillus mesophilus TaxID=2582849 RepID=UPI0013052D9D|nr:PfkB family carbohydrate kinase [Paenibacillus mesophilus]
MEEEMPGLSSVPQYSGLTRDKVVDLLQRIASLKAGVLGDACLDVYWYADMTMSELSRETPHYNLPVVRETFVPGAAGNVANNFKQLGCAEVSLCSVVGDDWRGALLQEALGGRGIDGSFLLSDKGRVTPAFCKTILRGLQDAEQEAPRIDFINLDAPHDALQRRLVAELDKMAAKVDVICVTDQLKSGITGRLLRERLRYWAALGKRIVVDSRDNIGKYKGVVVKPNEIETLGWCYGSLKHPPSSESDIIKAGMRLARHADAPCCVTLGEKGALWFEGGVVTYVPTTAAEPPIDIVGAGDTFSAALLSALGAGSPGPEAAAFAHLASAVSVRKLGGVGSATPQELLLRFDQTVNL